MGLNGGALPSGCGLFAPAPAERAGGCAVAAEAGVIGVWNAIHEVHINIGLIWASDGDHNIVGNGDGISCQNLCAVAAKRDVGNEIKLAVAARRVKLQLGISREDAATDIEHAVCTEYARFEHIRVSAGIIECDRSVAVDVGEERSALPDCRLVTAAVKLIAADVAPSLP